MNLSRSARTPALAAFALAATLVIGACAGASPQATPKAPGMGPAAATMAALPAEVSVAEAAALQEAGAFVLDVREPSEWAAGHIQGATLIPLGQLPSRVGEVPTDRNVVVVCRSGNRSAQGRDILRQAGLQAVTSMAGGMNDWTSAGMPVVTGS